MPFNWFGLIDLSYWILSGFVAWDENIKRNKDEKVEIINSHSLANFGQVRHILTDKTGTLTKRKFDLKICSIHGKLYSFQFDELKDESYIQEVVGGVDIIDENAPNKNEERDFASPYCEEVATFKVLKKFGYRLIKAKANLIQLKIHDKKRSFLVLGHNKYNKDRKKMSVVIKHQSSRNSYLLCKANASDSDLL